jgi:hypothetical protein
VPPQRRRTAQLIAGGLKAQVVVKPDERSLQFHGTAADKRAMGFLFYAQILFVMILAVTLYIMRRRVRLGRRIAKF